MKNLLHNIQILAMLALTMTSTTSCSEELNDVDDVQVSFTATLPTDIRTRSFGDAGQVNTLVVGIFDEQEEEIFRQSFTISGPTTDVKLTLAQHQTYNFVFWAYDNRQDSYDIDNLTAIKMNALPEPTTFAQAEAVDAFSATKKNITIKGNSSHSIELVRPLAQINVGTTGTPMPALLIAKEVSDTFHPFTNTVSSSGATEFTWTFSETITETFTVEDTEYNYLAMGYLFAPSTTTKIAVGLTLTDGVNSQTVEFPQVEIATNRRSNIAGKFTAE